MIYPRLLEPPRESFFLFGPRGTGKSTWIRERFPNAPRYDLLDTGEALRLLAEPATLWHELRGLPPGAWAVLDEVQKAPAVLDSVHRLIEERRVRFVLSGSSARKLRRGGANLLAGRAITVSMPPLVSRELSFEMDLPERVRLGMLPQAVTGAEPAAFLRSYVETYLMEEVKAEALTRNLGGFARFLEIAARQNGQVTNAAGIARDAGISRRTVDGYFEILTDTLLGGWLRAWRSKLGNRQVRGNKFFFFDSGVARACSGRLPYPPTPEEAGPLLETLVLGELRTYVQYRGLHYPLYYWRNYSGAEVDLLCETGSGFVAVEIKSSRRWDRRFGRGFRHLERELGQDRLRCFGVYLGERPARFGRITVLPCLDFLRRLWAGDIVRS